MSASQASTPKKGILLAIVAGLAIMFFYGLVVKSLDPQYVAGGTGTLTPYTGVFCFAAGVLITTPIFNTFAMSHPAQGNKVTMKDYLDERYGGQLYGSRISQSGHSLCAEQCRTGGSHDLGILCMERVQRSSQRNCTYDCDYVCTLCCGAGTDYAFKLIF